ncbi:MAG: hypothetical protein R2845_08110 [Thermomicrobiales bacterium]
MADDRLDDRRTRAQPGARRGSARSSYYYLLILASYIAYRT